MKSPFFSGDLANFISLFITFSFVAAITLRPSIFSASYLTEGFCVSFANTPFNSHVLCFYIDTFFTLVLGALVLWNSGDVRLQRVRENFFGIFGHGIGHLGLYFVKFEGDGASSNTNFATADISPVQRSVLFAGLLFFWGAFFLSLTPSKFFNAVVSIFNTIALAFYVPRVFGFTYVQTVLMTCFVTRDLLTSARKDVSYNVWCWCVNIPVVVVGWVEALSCDAGLINLGGHIWYDAVIPISVLVYVVIMMLRLDSKGLKSS